MGQDSNRPGARHTGDQPGTVNHPATSHQVGPPDPGHMLDPEDDVKPRSPGRTVNEDHRATGLGGIPGRRGRERGGAATPGCPDDGQQAPPGARCRWSVHGSRVAGHPTAVTRPITTLWTVGQLTTGMWTKIHSPTTQLWNRGRPS